MTAVLPFFNSNSVEKIEQPLRLQRQGSHTSAIYEAKLLNYRDRIPGELRTRNDTLAGRDAAIGTNLKTGGSKRRLIDCTLISHA